MQTEKWRELICKDCRWEKNNACTIPRCDFEPMTKREKMKKEFIEGRPPLVSLYDAERVFDDWYDNYIIPLVKLYAGVKKTEMSCLEIPNNSSEERVETDEEAAITV